MTAPEARKSAAARGRRVVGRVALALVALAAADLGIGLLLVRDGLFRGRPLPPFGATTHPRQRVWLERERTDPGARVGPGTFDTELGWTHRGGYRSADGLFSTGALGARGPAEYGPTPPEGVLRIACFGDSYTWCDVVTDEDAWTRRIENRRPGTEVMNFGVSGYGTDQALLRYRRDGRELGAQVVLLGILMDNVGRNVNRYRPLWYPAANACVAKPRFVLDGAGLQVVPPPFGSSEEALAAVTDGSILAELEPHEHWRGPELGPLRFSSLARLAAGWSAYRARSVERLWRDRDGEPYRVTLAIAEAFAREARADGARLFAVLVFPRPADHLSVLAGGERYWQGFLDDLGERGIPALDLSLPLEAAARGASSPELYAEGHLDAFGNLAVAEQLLTWIEEEAAGLVQR